MTPEEAWDAMLSVFKNTWDNAGYTDAVWSDIPNSTPPADSSVPWARVTVRHDDGGQQSLSNANGARLYGHSGTLYVQVFTPMSVGGAMGYSLAHLILQGYRDARSTSLRYTRQRIREQPVDGAFNSILCLIDFAYDL